jgi:hypothetical protein
MKREHHALHPALEGEGEEILRIAAMSCRSLTVDWEDNCALTGLSVDSWSTIRASAGQGKSFPQNIRHSTK